MMKQKDIALITVVIILSGFLSLLLMNYVFGGARSKPTKVIIVEKIPTDFPSVEKRYFNENSINYTQLIQIGSNENPKPFGNVSN